MACGRGIQDESEQEPGGDAGDGGDGQPLQVGVGEGELAGFAAEKVGGCGPVRPEGLQDRAAGLSDCVVQQDAGPQAQRQQR